MGFIRKALRGTAGSGRGFGLRRIPFLFKKGWQLFRREGFKGVWQKAQFHDKLAQGGSPGERYERWLERNSLSDQDCFELKRVIGAMTDPPLISVLVPVYNVGERWLRKCLDSVLNQLYPHWELCIADDASTEPHVRAVLEEYRSADSRVKVLYRETNGHIAQPPIQHWSWQAVNSSPCSIMTTS